MGDMERFARRSPCLGCLGSSPSRQPGPSLQDQQLLVNSAQPPQGVAGIRWRIPVGCSQVFLVPAGTGTFLSSPLCGQRLGQHPGFCAVCRGAHNRDWATRENVCPCSPAPFPARLTPFPSPPLLLRPLSFAPCPQKGSFLRAESKSRSGYEHRLPGIREPSGDTHTQPPFPRALQPGEPCPADSQPSSLLCCPGLLPRVSSEGSG